LRRSPVRGQRAEDTVILGGGLCHGELCCRPSRIPGFPDSGTRTHIRVLDACRDKLFGTGGVPRRGLATRGTDAE
jgi:hypothetical protein